jgi:hypothetical protein
MPWWGWILIGAGAVSAIAVLVFVHWLVALGESEWGR